MEKCACHSPWTEYVHINKLKIISKCIEVYEGFCTSVKQCSYCNQIRARVADENCLLIIIIIISFILR